jgi:hypothetical protein
MKKRPKPSPKKNQSHSVTGVVPANFHEGSRSELLADYLFSSWGTVTPVRRQDDFGLDLYCTLTERIGKLAVVRDYFVVQVKSTNDPWHFKGRDSVRWLVEYPQPLFLACVDKKAGIVHVYQVTPRFFVGATPPLPENLILQPEDRDNGSSVKWEGGKEEFSLSAPILRISISDLLDDAKMDQLRKVFMQWVRLDRENCDLFSHGLLRFRMPYSYKVNEPPPQSIVEAGTALPDLSQISRGILTAAEGAECIGGQFGRREDRLAALFAALFVNHLQQTYPDVFRGKLRWNDRLPADLGQVVCTGLNSALGCHKSAFYRYEGIETVAKMIRRNRVVATFLNKKKPSSPH